MSNRKEKVQKGPQGFGPGAGMGAPPEKARDFKGTIKKLMKIVSACWRCEVRAFNSFEAAI